MYAMYMLCLRLSSLAKVAAQAKMLQDQDIALRRMADKYKEAKKNITANKPFGGNFIPKPAGTTGDGYNLQTEMGFEDNPKKYQYLHVCIYSFLSTVLLIVLL